MKNRVQHRSKGKKVSSTDYYTFFLSSNSFFPHYPMLIKKNLYL